MPFFFLRIRFFLLSALSGILVGTASSFFLIFLDKATFFRQTHPGIILALPVMGFIMGWVYHHYGKDSGQGTNLILEEIDNPQKTIPARMAPLVCITTILTHLFGGSAGREGTSVQMGASLSDQLSLLFKLNPQERRTLLIAGLSAGFSSAIGTPFAGMMFGLEVIRHGKPEFKAWIECFIASFVGYGMTCLWAVPRHSLIDVPAVSFHVRTLFMMVVAGLVFGLAAQIFIHMTQAIKRLQKRGVSYPPMRLFYGGSVVVGLFFLEGSYRYAGLGLETIHQASQMVFSFQVPLLKAIFTALTVGSGFSGGEFIPLVFIGTTLGSVMSAWLSVSLPLLAGVGFASVFGGASKTPIACSIMAIELFGWGIAPYVCVSCCVSYLVSGKLSLYASQRLV